MRRDRFEVYFGGRLRRAVGTITLALPVTLAGDSA